MRWKYFIPHIWHEERAPWEDVLLLPDDENYNGEALWLTITAIGPAPSPGVYGYEFLKKEYEENIQQLGVNSTHIDNGDMLVKAVDFTKAEMMDFVLEWFKYKNLEIDELVEVPIEEFAGRSSHADLLITLKQKYGNSEDGVDVH